MYWDINPYLLIFIGWFIRISYQLECLQCTSPIQRVPQNWDHSCLDGTLRALPCHESINGSESIYKQCVSALYRAGPRGISGVLIYRACTTIPDVQHECDPHASSINFEKTENFYCSHTCAENGCNQHSVEEITSNRSELLKTTFLLYDFISLILLLNFRCNFLF